MSALMKRNNLQRPAVAIIGAGAAGITCARVLKDHGCQVTVFEKSRGLGGRLATRRGDHGMAFDHGVQYVTARGSDFREYMYGAMAEGAAALWHPVRADATEHPEQDLFVGTPTMNAFLKLATSGIEFRLQTEVESIERHSNGWTVWTGGEDVTELFDIVVSTAPAPQAQALLSGEAWLGQALADVTIAPCWALLLAFNSPVNLGFDAWSSQDGDLAWIANTSSKPRRELSSDCWTVHASPAWSERFLEYDRNEIARLMIELLPREFDGHLADICNASAHRWRYAMTGKPLGNTHLVSDDETLFVGGDWCLGARVECAYESGLAIARALIGAEAR